MTNSQTDEITNRIIAAAKSRNYQEVIDLAAVGRDFLVVEQRHKEIQAKLKSINGNVTAVASQKYRKCIIEATQGGLKYSYLLVSGPLRKRILAKTEMLKIHIPATGDTFTTDIYLKNKNLREREAIGRFYKTEGVKVGDLLVLEETATNEWVLRKSDQLGATFPSSMATQAG